MKHFYVLANNCLEICYTVECNSTLTEEERQILLEVLTKGFDTSLISEAPFLDISDGKGVEIGPNLNSETAFSTNVRSIYANVGLGSVTRIERSFRYLTGDVNETIASHCDKMTQEVYPEPLQSFDSGKKVKPVVVIPLLEEGITAFDGIKGLSFSEQDKRIYYEMFTEREGRNPTDVELFDLLNSNCEHSRHGWFNAEQILNGILQKLSAFDLIKSTLKKTPDRSVIGFHDNSSSIRGFSVETLSPTKPGQVTGFQLTVKDTDITCTVETHNFPTGIEPYQGAATGTGGRLRDGMATGRGSEIGAGIIGYSVASLHIPGYSMPGEDPNLCSPSNMASGLQILIEGSNGASNYGNEFGEGVFCGYTRNFFQRLPNNQAWGFVKPILLAGGIGQMRHDLAEKNHAEKGLLIVQVGGPAYRIGFGGGAASSGHHGDNDSSLDFDAVQRGNAEMANKMYRVIRACNEMGINTPIELAHDQGAGGPGNVLKELVEKSGGRIGIRKINSADPTMSVLELWVCEYQERCGLLIKPERIEEFIAICKREKVPCEVLGEVTGDGRFVVEDSNDGSTPVDFNLKAILADFPRSTYRDNTINQELAPIFIHDSLTVFDALEQVFKLLAVGSKGFLVHKVDRHVGGLIAQQQCVGPLQLPLSNAAVTALSHFDTKGVVTALGEKPLCMIIDPKAGARLSVSEMFLNMMCVLVTSNKHIKSSVNWMWAPKKPGEGVALFEAVESISNFMPQIGVAADGGKDSLSMAAEVDGELVKSPRTVVVTGYAPVEDITKIITPDIKEAGNSTLFFFDLSNGKARLGGSALGQALSQIGNETPDIDDPKKLLDLFNVIQYLIKMDLISAYHDVSDGGLITTLCEMAFAGNCGIDVNIPFEGSPLEKLFAEELGIVIEISNSKLNKVLQILESTNLDFQNIGGTLKQKKVKIFVNDKYVLGEDTDGLRSWWTKTSFMLEKEQGNQCAVAERVNTFNGVNPDYKLTFTPEPTSDEILNSDTKINVAVLREEGSNGDREMTSALFLAGFNPVDITMGDLLSGRATLDDFRGLVPVGGFSYADYPESAKGWAVTIENNPILKSMFTRFKNRSDTWSFAPCNGCQMQALLGFLFPDDMPKEQRPRFTRNDSGKFESRCTTLRIPQSNSIMFTGMDGSVLPVWSAHAEGKLLANEALLEELKAQGNVPVFYADEEGRDTQNYPCNPNGSPLAIAGLCSSDGRHTIMMPHPERLFQLWQFPWLPVHMQNLNASPWLRIFQNARVWCEKN